MKAVILAGGLGTRLRPVTLEIPKPLIPINGKTLTEHVINIAKRAGVKEIYLSLGYMSEKVRAYFKEGNNLGVNIKYIIENQPLGTGGWLNLIKKDDFNEDFFVLNGDNLFDLDMGAFLDFHKKCKGTASISLTKVEDVSRFGIAELSCEKIIRFCEKPSPKEATSNLANAGYYVFSPGVFDYIPHQKAFSLERDLFPKLAQLNRLCGFPSEALWFDTGTFESWEKAIHNWKH